MEVSNLSNWIHSFDKLNQLFLWHFVNTDFKNLTPFTKYTTDFMIFNHKVCGNPVIFIFQNFYGSAL